MEEKTEHKKIYRTLNYSTWKSFRFTLGMQISLLTMLSISIFYDSDYKIVFMICACLLALYFFIKVVKEIKRTHEFSINDNHFLYEDQKIPFENIREIALYKGNVDIITINRKESIRIYTREKEDLEQLKIELIKTIKNSGINMRNEY